MNITDLLNNITDDKTIKKWKETAAKNIRDFTKRTNPFKGLKVSNYYLYIDTKSRTYSIELSGVKPNLGHAKGFSAPVEKRKVADKPIHVHLDKGWRTVHTERVTSPTPGVARPLDTSYYGVSGKPKAFFGLKRKNGKEAFGLIGDTAVPIYSEEGFVEFLTQDSEKELERILIEAGYTAIGV